MRLLLALYLLASSAGALADMSESRIGATIEDGPQVDAFGRLRVSDSQLVESIHFAQSAHNLLTNKSTTGSATIAHNSATSSLRLTTTTGATDSAIAQSKRYFRYNPGRSYLVTLSGNIGAPKANVRKRWGYFDAGNGLFFEQTSSELAAVIRTDASGSAVDTRIVQSSWNTDRLDGTGPSKVTLDPSKHNLYMVDFLWHGAGRVRFGIFYDGKFIVAHTVSGANNSSTPYIRVPSLPLRFELVNTAAPATSTTVDMVCFAYQSEASDPLAGAYAFTASMVAAPTNVGNTIIPLLSIRPKTTFNSLTNRIPIVPKAIQVAANQNTIYVVVYLNATLTGASFASAGAESAVEFDTAATAVSGGTKVKEFYVSALSNLVTTTSAELLSELQLLTLGLDVAGSVPETLTIAARSTGGGSSSLAQIEWEEFQ